MSGQRRGVTHRLLTSWARRARLAWSAGAIAAGVALLPAAVDAHDIGTTRVEARFAADGTYVIDIVTDPVIVLARASARAPGACDGGAAGARRSSIRQATIADVERCREPLSAAVSIRAWRGEVAAAAIRRPP